MGGGGLGLEGGVIGCSLVFFCLCCHRFSFTAQPYEPQGAVDGSESCRILRGKGGPWGGWGAGFLVLESMMLLCTEWVIVSLDGGDLVREHHGLLSSGMSVATLGWFVRVEMAMAMGSGVVGRVDHG